MNVQMKEVQAPVADNAGIVVPLTDKTIAERKKKLIGLMKEHGVSSVVVYADKEHGSNFEYLVGFVPRFEEALMVMNVDGTTTLILGNENYNKVNYSRVNAVGYKCSLFSLPNQPMQTMDELKDIFAEISIDTSGLVGVVGWKMIPEMTKQFDIPAFIVDTLAAQVGQEKLINATNLFIGPKEGARVTNNANEIAHYEYGASLASDAVLEAMDGLEVGKNELKTGELLLKHGQYNSVVTIAAFGERFIGGNLYPTENTLAKGNKVALTVGYRGGLSSRTGYAVETEAELENEDPGYLEEVVKPYFEAYHYWLTNIKIGANGGEFYQQFADFYPQEKYGWELCPGHLTADEEWMSSPFYAGSDAIVQSGMIFQVDFIPSQAPHQGVSAESTVALADADLRSKLEQDYPELWQRIVARRTYLRDELGIHLPEEVLPLASTLGYYRPFMLDAGVALVMGE